MIPLYKNYPALSPIENQIEAARALLCETFAAGGRLLLCGNGGSAADCDHIVGELCKGFLSMRPLGMDSRAALTASYANGLKDPDLDLLSTKLQGGLSAISLPSQTALVSAFCNDVDPALVYAQLVFAHGRPGDLLWCLSTSGNSRNVVLAAKAARARNIRTLSLCGEKTCELDQLSNVIIHAPGTETYRIQEYHLPIYHYLCAAVEEMFFGAHKM